ncbi:AraC-like DNA-binding protein [Kineococcus radiotolerans]|uniref:AraC-like DNA-binding protein n=1 Tax=Kineococcus radiotolerans TaxID=131568 RepID=A0A7W4TQV5_KINRA|nr:AraC family transcriptional regulator [Kineococcus radiotolerans]MBB2903382.1 AraC-like DNA-binding protein [Kineococcus radiotolerans]
MDPLEDVLALIGVQSSVSAGLVAGGDWAMTFPPPVGVKFVAVRAGSCHLAVQGSTQRHVLAAGDCCLLTRRARFTLASDLSLPTADARTAFAKARSASPGDTARGHTSGSDRGADGGAPADGLARTGTGEEVFILGGSFDFGERAHALLLDALPPVIVVPAASPAARALDWALAQIEHEVRTQPLGAGLVAEHLATVMLVHVLRLHLTQDASDGGALPGLLAGLADPVVATALRALHAHPARAWTVAALAASVGVSRSTLAARFSRALGHGPLEYLTQWRIALAAQQLRAGNRTLASIATAVGYGSESALSTAFKRVLGTSPRAYLALTTG